MTIYVVIGRNGLLKTIGPVGAATTRARAEEIQRDHEWVMDESAILEVELDETDAKVSEPVEA